MHPSEASLWFDDTPLDGWNGTSWVTKVAYGDFHAFDRFITERTFGAKKRIFHTPEEHKIDVTTYPVVRTPDGKIWLVSSENADIQGTEAYAQSYLLLEASIQAELIEHTTETLASGAEGPLVESTVGTYYCDLERYSAANSDLFPNVVYGSYELTIGNHVPVTVEREFKINGVYYEVKEVIPELLTLVCRCLRRG